MYAVIDLVVLKSSWLPSIFDTYTTTQWTKLHRVNQQKHTHLALLHGYWPCAYDLTSHLTWVPTMCYHTLTSLTPFAPTISLISNGVPAAQNFSEVYKLLLRLQQQQKNNTGKKVWLHYIYWAFVQCFNLSIKPFIYEWDSC